MHTVATKDLQPGMVTATPVMSRHGQMIVEAHKMLTTQMIAHLEFYGIESARIIDGALPVDAIQSMAEEKEAVDRYSERVRNSKEFKVFKANYEKKVPFLEKSINDFVTKNIPFDQEALLSCALDLFARHSTTISMFDMLHNMRKITDSTYAHSLNVSLISRMIGMWQDYNADDLETLTLGGLLHDIGKSKIPPEIINKPGRLTPEEYELVKKHSEYGYELLKNQNVSVRIKKIALTHHERCDGSGYPIGLIGDDIDDFANIVAIADVYDAMTADRCYRRGVCPFEVIATFEREGLGKYKPQFITSFLEHIANTYINNDVMLSNGMTGKIVLINKHRLTHPVVRLEDGIFINLEKRPELYVQTII